MEFFESLLKGFAENPIVAFFVVILIACVYLYKARETDRVAREAERQVHAAQIQKLNDDHKTTIEKVIPVADKLGDAAIAVEKSVGAIERATERLERLERIITEKS